MLLVDYAGSIFLVCAAVAPWRPWRVAFGAPTVMRRTPGPGQQVQRGDGNARFCAGAYPGAALVADAMAELDGTTGLAVEKSV